MTENEAIEIIEKIFPKWNGDSKWLSIDNMQKIINSYTKVLNEIQKYREPWKNEFLADMKSNHVETLSELRQYRNLGTIEFLTDMKSNYVEVLSELRQYQKIGTVEECREAREKKYCEPKYLGKLSPICCRIGKCRCGNTVKSYQKFCNECGIELDWGNVTAWQQLPEPY